MTKIIVAYGEPFDKQNFVGPFDGWDEAQEWADFEIGSGNSWWLLELENPVPATLDSDEESE